MANKRTLTIEFLTETGQMKKGFAELPVEADKAGTGIVAKLKGKLSGLSGLGTAALGGIFGGGTFAAVSALQPAIAGVVDEYQESVKVGRETNRVIQTTGGAAHVTAKQVADLAEAQSDKIGVDDEIIQKGANLLLTFKNVRNEVGKGNDIFTQSVKISDDMAAAFGGTQSQAAVRLGKALNDPVKGIASLTRVGVSFTEQQKDQIKALVASGDTLSAQKVILGELRSEVGGAAEAAATPLDKIKVRLANFQEAAGRWTVETAIPWLTQLWPKVEKEWDAGVAKAREIIDPFLRIVEGLWDRFGSRIVGFMSSWWGAIKDIFEGAFNVIKGIVEVGLAIINGDWSQAWEGIKDIFSGVWQIMVGIIDQVWNVISTIISTALTIIGAVLSGAWNTFLSIVSGAWGAISGVVSSGVNSVVGFISGLPGAIAGFAWQMLGAGLSLGGAVISGISSGISSAAGAIADVAGGIFSAFKQGWNAAARAINDFIPDKIGFDTPFGFIGIDLPDNPLPTFHTGGIVPGRPGQEVFALLQAGERVVTGHSSMNTDRSSSSSAPIVVPITLQLDGKTIAAATVTHYGTPGVGKLHPRAIDAAPSR